MLITAKKWSENHKSKCTPPSEAPRPRTARGRSAGGGQRGGLLEAHAVEVHERRGDAPGADGGVSSGRGEALISGEVRCSDAIDSIEAMLLMPKRCMLSTEATRAMPPTDAAIDGERRAASCASLISPGTSLRVLTTAPRFRDVLSSKSGERERFASGGELRLRCAGPQASGASCRTP